jgi:uncharacterized metal-binding protein
MPSGQTHDRITLWSLPLVAGLTFDRTQSGSLTLLVSGGYLFSGLMFGPDLDIHSRQYRRWGILRWIWLPYRRSMRHRSVLSHGLIIGTVVRLLYLLLWLGLLSMLLLLAGAIASQMLGRLEHWDRFIQGISEAWISGLKRSLQHHLTEWLALGIGLELGALSHSLSDWAGSRYKRWRKIRSHLSSPGTRQKRRSEPAIAADSSKQPTDSESATSEAATSDRSEINPPPYSQSPHRQRTPQLPLFKRPMKP